MIDSSVFNADSYILIATALYAITRIQIAIRAGPRRDYRTKIREMKLIQPVQSIEAVIVIMIFFERLAQPYRHTSGLSPAFYFNIHSNIQSAKTFLAGFGKRGENASFPAKEIRL